MMKLLYTLLGEPLKQCPQCGFDLGRHGYITVELSIGGQVVDIVSSLDERGFLRDIDRIIERGYWRQASCAICEEPLSDLKNDEDKGVLETNMDSLTDLGFLLWTTKEQFDDYTEVIDYLHKHYGWQTTPDDARAMLRKIAKLEDNALPKGDNPTTLEHSHEHVQGTGGD